MSLKINGVVTSNPIDVANSLQLLNQLGLKYLLLLSTFFLSKRFES